METLDLQKLPKHVAIIMDGNGRWAQQRQKHRVEGHRAGIHAVRDTVETAAQEIAALVLALLIGVTVTATEWPETAERIWTDTEAVAVALFSDFVLPFEVVSVLLLAAVIGGVFIAKRERKEPG